MTDQEWPFPPGPGGAPPPAFAERRVHAPLAPATLPSGDEATVAVRYADVHEVLASPHFTRELTYPGAPRLVGGADVGDDPRALLNMDPPRHTRIRRIVAGAFTPRRVETWRPRVAAIAEELVAGVLAQGPPADLVEAYAFPLPIRVICELLGVPVADRARFGAWSDVFLSDASRTPEERMTAGRQFTGYIRELIAERRARRGDALLDALIEAHDAGDRLTEGELVSLVIIMIVGGHETTANVLARGVLSLLGTDQYGLLCADPGRIPAAVEEILRCEMPGDAGLLRVATREVELPSGVVAEGEAVLPSMAAANRDPEVFPGPERFDLSRDHCPHLSFGHGTHYCLGANLARLELRVGFATLTRVLPGLKLAGEVPWKSGLLVRGPERLPVTW